MNKFNVSYKVDGEVKVTQELSSDDITNFKDGSVNVTVPDDWFSGTLSPNNSSMIVLSAYLQSMDDLMVVAQIFDVFKRKVPDIKCRLEITSPVYSRYDRVMLEGMNDAFGAKVFVDFLCATGAWDIVFFDLHSDVMLNLLKGRHLPSYVFQQASLFKVVCDIEEYIHVYPDKGAIKKRAFNGLSPVKFEKTRDVLTGKITGIECVEGLGFIANEQESPFIVVDDICEGGGTFLGLAKEFWKVSSNANELQLYVTHGLFTNGAIEKLLENDLYSHIYCYIMKESTYNGIPDYFKSKVTVKHIVKGI